MIMENIGGGHRMKKFLFIALSLVVLSGCNNSSNNEYSSQGNQLSTKSIGGTTDPTIQKLQSEIRVLITNENWKEAKNALSNYEYKSIDNYNEIYSYVDARLDYITEKATGKILYEPILKKLNSINLDTYTGEYKDEIVSFKDAFNEERLNQYKSNFEKGMEKGKEKQKELDSNKDEKIKELLEKEDYKEISLLTVYDRENNVDGGAIYNYAHSQIYKQEDNDDMMIYYLALIPLSYNGKYADLIMEEKLSIQSREKWLEKEESIKKYNENKEKEELEKEKESLKPNPSIGMTKEEIIESSWGKPNDINKTTTRYAVREQWVYSNSRYIYFEDGLVTTIQE